MGSACRDGGECGRDRCSDQALTWRRVRGSSEEVRFAQGYYGPARQTGRRTLCDGEEEAESPAVAKNRKGTVDLYPPGGGRKVALNLCFVRDLEAATFPAFRGYGRVNGQAPETEGVAAISFERLRVVRARGARTQ